MYLTEIFFQTMTHAQSVTAVTINNAESTFEKRAAGGRLYDTSVNRGFLVHALDNSSI